MIVICDSCGNEFLKSNAQMKRTKHNFCNRSCSATYTNHHSPKRKLNPNITLEDYKNIGLYRTYKSRVSEHAKRVYDSYFKFSNDNLHKKCVICGYSKHYEICHIHPICSFPLDTKLCVVNDIKNLVAMCRNCHWEFDNGLIKKEELVSKAAHLL